MDADLILDPLSSCPLTRFVVRSCCEEDKLKEFMQDSIYCKQIILISGHNGSGKSSFLNWAKDKIRNMPKSVVVEECFYNNLELQNSQYDNPFSTYDYLLRKLKEQNDFPGKVIDLIKDIITHIKSIGYPSIVDVELKSINESRIRQLISDLVQVFVELTRDDNILVIILDDVQNASNDGFELLLTLFKDSPNRVFFIVAFETEPEPKKETIYKYNKLSNYFTDEIILHDMNIEEIISIAEGYNKPIDKKTAEFLKSRLGSPHKLVRCFNELQKLEPTFDNIQKKVNELIRTSSLEYLYVNEDKETKMLMQALCVLKQPIEHSIIECMLKDFISVDSREILIKLKSRFILREVRDGHYLFVTQLREYVRQTILDENARKDFCSKAANCYPKDDCYGLVDYLYLAGKYKEAWELSLRLSNNLFNFDHVAALQLTKRAKICGEISKNRSMFDDALYQEKFQSLIIAEEQKDKRGFENNLFNIERIFYRMGERKEARELYQYRLKLTEELGGNMDKLQKYGMQQYSDMFDMLDRRRLEGGSIVMDKDQVSVPIDRKVNLGKPISEIDAAKRTTFYRVDNVAFISDKEVVEHVRRARSLGKF